jgi:hypothetical protein
MSMHPSGSTGSGTRAGTRSGASAEGTLAQMQATCRRSAAGAGHST